MIKYSYKKLGVHVFTFHSRLLTTFMLIITCNMCVRQNETGDTAFNMSLDIQIEMYLESFCIGCKQSGVWPLLSVCLLLKTPNECTTEKQLSTQHILKTLHP